MKKILLSALATLAVSASALAGAGTLASPYTVAEVIAMGNDANVPGVYVEGYVVGFINGMNYSDAVFGLPTKDENQTNIIIGGSTAEDDIKYCLPVQLPAGDVRANLNLWKNPDVLGHKVILGGDIIKYFGQIGIKNTTSYEWVGDAPELGTGGGSGSGGSGSTDEGYLVNGMDDFTIDYVKLPSELSYVWQWDSQYGAKATAYYNSTNYETEAILISPEIQVPADAKSATFSQALNYLNGNNRADYVNVVIREGNGAWQTATVSAWPAGNSWAFSDNCGIDLTAYAGKTIQIGFQYKSTSACAPTWEVKRLVIGGTPATTPDTPTTPEGESVTFPFNDPTLYGFTPADDETEIALAGQTITKDDVTIAFAQNGSASTAIRLFKSAQGTWSFRFYNNTEFTVTAPEGTHLTGIEFSGSNIDKNWSYSNGSISGTVWTPSSEVNSVTIAKTANGDNPAIDSITVYFADGEFTPGTPDTPPTGDLEDVTYNFNDPTLYGYNPTDDETEIALAGQTFTNGDVTLTFAQNESASTAIRLFKSAQGTWSFRFYNNTEFTVTVPEEAALVKIVFTGNNLDKDWSYSNGSFSGDTWTASGSTNTVTIGKTANGNNPVIDSMTVYYTAGSGVEAVIAADDSEAVYYNLQGQRVAHPDRGIFVKVVGGKAVKILK